MYKLWCIFLMQLFNFTPLKRYDLCAGALALTLGGARSWSATGLIKTSFREKITHLKSVEEMASFLIVKKLPQLILTFVRHT